MKYKAHPTTYAGVNFRSRLEARWAAFFDLCDWSWDYEPIDLEGWVPDFAINTPCCVVYAEVKPLEHPDGGNEQYSKAFAHWRDVQVLCLGTQPRDYDIGALLDPPWDDIGVKIEDRPYQWIDLWNYLSPPGAERLWREAGNRTRWRGR